MSTTPYTSPDFLKCINCHVTFRDPLTLHCGHNFCAKCVHELASNSDQEKENSSFTVKCAVCGRKAAVTSEGDKLSGQIGSSIFIKRLADDQLPYNKGESECSVCKTEGERKDAETWCSTCEHSMCPSCQRVHRNLHPQHNTTDISPQTPRTKQAKCGKHEDASIDFFCEDCESAMCQKCCILEHRNCKKVTPLEESTARLDELLVEYSKELENDIPNVETKIAQRKRQIEKMNTAVEKAEQVIDDTCEVLVAEVLNQQEELKMRLKHLHEENLDRFNSDVKTGEMTIADAKQRLGLAKEVKNSPSATDHYEIYKLFATLRGPMSNFKTSDKNKNDGTNIEFVTNKTILQAAINKRKIGYLKGVAETPRTKDGQRIKIDTGHNGVYGIVVLSCEGIKVIVTTNRNYKLVQAFYSHQDEIKSNSIRLTHSPHDITQLSPSRAATTVPKKKQIMIFRVEPKLVTDSIIKTQLRYTGLTFLNESTLAASGEETPFIDIIDMAGNRLRSFGADIFNKPQFLITTLDNHILVSDAGYWRIVCISDEGQMLYQYNPKDRSMLGAPSGVSQGVAGDVYVVDKSHHKVIQLDQEGQYASDLLTFVDDISDPSCVFVDDDNFMYVSVEERFVQVHQLGEN